MPARRVAFCSFKGGAGRTVALANVASRLARGGHRVGCIDLDIESCGLNQVFGLHPLADTVQTVQKYFLTDATWKQAQLPGRKPDFEVDRHFAPFVSEVSVEPSHGGVQPPSGKIFLLSARPEPLVTTLALRNPDFQECTSRLFGQFERYRNLDYLLIDCRSGVSTLTLPGMRWSHEVLMFFRAGQQHRDGTSAMLKWILFDRERRIQAAFAVDDDAALPQRIGLVPVGVPPSLPDHLARWMKEQVTQDEVRPLGAIRDYEPLRVQERIFLGQTEDGSAGITQDYDNLAAYVRG